MMHMNTTGIVAVGGAIRPCALGTGSFDATLSGPFPAAI